MEMEVLRPTGPEQAPPEAPAPRWKRPELRRKVLIGAVALWAVAITAVVLLRDLGPTLISVTPIEVTGADSEPPLIPSNSNIAGAFGLGAANIAHDPGGNQCPPHPPAPAPAPAPPAAVVSIASSASLRAHACASAICAAVS